MEILTILLSGLLGFVTPAGFLVDKTGENAIRSQLKSALVLKVRVDNAPVHQLLQGKVRKLRVAGRSLVLKAKDIHISLLELETDAIALRKSNGSIGLNARSLKLEKPLQVAVRVVLTEKDINKLLNSSELISQLRKINLSDSVGSSRSKKNAVYKFVSVQVKILENQRLRLQIELAPKQGKETLLVKVESGLSVISGRQIKLVNPTVALNEEVAPEQFVNLVLNNLNRQLDLRKLEGDGVQMRILKLNMRTAEIEIASFVRIEPSSKLIGD